MRAAWYDTVGEAEDVLQVGTLPMATPGVGEVLVGVYASGVNPSDTKKRAGWLGTGTIAPRLRKYRPFKQARKFVHTLKLETSLDWRSYTKSGHLPADIPANPHNINAYQKDWIS